MPDVTVGNDIIKFGEATTDDLTNPLGSTPPKSGTLPDEVVLIKGCTDPSALNYNKDATIDDDSCEYAEPEEEPTEETQ